MIKLPVILDDIKDRKTGDCILKFETRLLSDPEFIELRQLRGLEGKLIFDINEIQNEEEVLDSIDEDLETKSPSQRLRNVLYVYWQENKIEGKFKEFYATQMERIIQKIKNKLP